MQIPFFLLYILLYSKSCFCQDFYLFQETSNTPNSSADDVESTSPLSTPTTESTSPLSTATTTTEDCSEVSTIRNLKIIPGDFNVNLTWDPPEDAYCATSYKIYENEIEVDETETTEFTISNLNACQKYIISVAVLYNDNIGDLVNQEVTTNIPSPFSYSVTHISTNLVDKTLSVAWDIQGNISHCISNFQINVKSVTTGSYVINSPKTSIPPIPSENITPCDTFYFDITPIVNENITGLTESTTHKIPDEPTITPSNSILLPNKTASQMTWQIEEFSKNMCPISSLSVKCEAKDADNPAGINWIIKNANASVEIKDSIERPTDVEIIIENLSEFTNYTCYGTVINSAGPSAEQEIHFQTSEEVPSKPENLEIKNISPNSFEVSWETPAKIPGIFQNYFLVIHSLGPQHYIQPSCYTEIPDKEVNLTEMVYTYSEALPDFSFNVKLSAVDRAGFGESVEKEALTSTADPEAVSNLESSKFEGIISLYDYEITTNISWDAPCNTNGPLKNFIVNVTNNYVDDDGTNNTTYNMTKNDNDTDIHYQMILSDLEPYNKYNIEIVAVLEDETKGEITSTNFTSPPGYPQAPEKKEITPKVTGFNVSWLEPHPKYGPILNYSLTIKTIKPIHWMPEDCQSHNKSDYYETTETYCDFDEGFPDYEYKISIQARTEAGLGIESVITVNTSETDPENVRTINVSVNYLNYQIYNAMAQLTFLYPCNTNGHFQEFVVMYKGSRLGFKDHTGQIVTNKTSSSFNVKPDYNYDVTVTTKTMKFSSTSEPFTFHSKPGVPRFNSTISISPKSDSSTTSFELSKHIFSNTNGDILYYAIFVTPKMSKAGISFGFWEGTKDTWPSDMTKYEVTDIFWNPFTDGNKTVHIVLGDLENCDANTKFCNNLSLQPGEEYSLIIRALTSYTYTDSLPIDFQMGSLVNVQLVLGLFFGLLSVIILITFMAILYKRRMKKEQKTIAPTDSLPLSVPIKKFIDYYNQLKLNPNLLRNEYGNLSSLCRELQLETTYAVLNENKRKNRYSNILPYDLNRVKLNIDEDDDIASDYINASYIKGYSGRIEYIATQGPLESTCKDFWRMIMQENVSIIVMVAQFAEQSKEKCFKYFPGNHTSMTFGDDIKIVCVSELHFSVYCVRTLKIKKGNQQHTVTHMQFLEWPDFGVPAGTEHMLQFCQQIRERVKPKEDVIVVHCSAGVGRTGTLISIDILLQTINDKKPLNVFTTVFELRKQRINMVQTEKQYMYVYTSIKDALEYPTTCSAQTENIYENVGINRSMIKSHLLPSEIESPV